MLQNVGRPVIGIILNGLWQIIYTMHYMQTNYKSVPRRQIIGDLLDMSVLLYVRVFGQCVVVKIGGKGGGGGGGGMGGEGEMRQEAMNTSMQWASYRDIDNSFIWYMGQFPRKCPTFITL